MKISEFIKKIQRQPVYIRKIILWSSVIIIGILLVVWWIKSAQKEFKEFQREEFIERLNLPSFEEELKGLKEIKVPEISEEKLKRLEELLGKAEENSITEEEMAELEEMMKEYGLSPSPEETPKE